MTSCKNCGHNSHCGNPLWKTVEQRSEYNDGHKEMEQIEVCKEKEMVGIDCNNVECENPHCTCDPCECTKENPCECCEDHQVQGP